MLSASLSCISCYLKASCFRPKPLQKHQQPEHEIKKRSPRTLQFWNLQTLPKPPRNPPQTPPKPLKMEPKSSPGASKTPFGEHSEYKHQKKTPKSGPREAKTLQTPPKTLPKPFPNPPKINWKVQAQKKAFLEACCFTIFLDFDLKNNQFFNGFLLRSSIQIAVIFGALSPNQSIVF